MRKMTAKRSKALSEAVMDELRTVKQSTLDDIEGSPVLREVLFRVLRPSLFKINCKPAKAFKAGRAIADASKLIDKDHRRITKSAFITADDKVMITDGKRLLVSKFRVASSNIINPEDRVDGDIMLQAVDLEDDYTKVRLREYHENLDLKGVTEGGTIDKEGDVILSNSLDDIDNYGYFTSDDEHVKFKILDKFYLLPIKSLNFIKASVRENRMVKITVRVIRNDVRMMHFETDFFDLYIMASKV
jgi:hypothetical protein